MNLEELGWDAFFADAFEPYAADNLIPARVSARHHGPCELFTELGRWAASPLGEAVRRRAARGRRLGRGPAGRRRAEGGHRSRPAATHLLLAQRGEQRTVEQVVAANVDTVFVVTAFGDLNPRRLERYLASAWDSGSSPVIVVNKSDVADDPRGARGGRAGGDGRAGPPGERRHRRGPRRARLVPRRGGRCPARLLGCRQVDTREPLRRPRGSGHRRDERGRPRAAHHESPRARPPPLGRGPPRHAGDARSSSSGRTRRSSTRRSPRSASSRPSAGSRTARTAASPDARIRRALSDGTLSQERWDSYTKLQREIRALAIRRTHGCARRRARRGLASPGASARAAGELLNRTGCGAWAAVGGSCAHESDPTRPPRARARPRGPLESLRSRGPTSGSAPGSWPRSGRARRRSTRAAPRRRARRAASSRRPSNAEAAARAWAHSAVSRRSSSLARQPQAFRRSRPTRLRSAPAQSRTSGEVAPAPPRYPGVLHSPGQGERLFEQSPLPARSRP